MRFTNHISIKDLKDERTNARKENTKQSNRNIGPPEFPTQWEESHLQGSNLKIDQAWNTHDYISPYSK